MVSDSVTPFPPPAPMTAGCQASLSFTAAAAAKSLQSCPTLCDPIDGSPPGSPVPGILQARILEWDAISFSNACKWKVKVKSLSRVRLLATPLLRFMIELVVLLNHLILCSLFSSCPQSFPASGCFSNESALCIWWPKYWSFSNSPSNEYLGTISSRIV